MAPYPVNDGFVSVAVLTPEVAVADVASNVRAVVGAVEEAAGEGASIVVLPECVLTGYTVADLLWQDTLLLAAEEGLGEVARQTSDLDVLAVVGLPLCVGDKLYNVAAVISRGRILGVVPKLSIPTYNEFYEGRWFSEGPQEVHPITVAGQDGVPFGARQLFRCAEMPELVIGVEICEDLWVPAPPSIGQALAGATLICNPSASNALVGKADYRRDLVRGQSARLICAYAYASCGWGESTQDVVFSGHDLLCENGRTLAEAAPFGEGRAMADIDVVNLRAERRRMSTFQVAPTPTAAGFTVTDFSLALTEHPLRRAVDPHPFVPDDPATRAQRCEDILDIQAHGLAKRLAHTHAPGVVMGVSGGLDSTLALLVCARAFDLVGLDRQGILAVTMPGFGTTDRTHDNARAMADALGCELREVPIAPAVRQHFADIGHDESVHDVTYENSQARERTQILMDLANQTGGLVIGTGDLSELALGWATYNGDHMSMYGVNASVPKTLVRHLVRHVADTCGDDALTQVLLDVLDTPVSPELLPAEQDGTISQRTEDLVGPYELHDFFLHGMLRQGFPPSKVLRLARIAFADTYDDEAIGRWLVTFYRRFFSQQFKRSCLPDGPKVGSVAVSPRGDLRMPSDAVASLWVQEAQASVDALIG